MLCIVGGLLLIIQGATGSIGLIALIEDIPTLFPELAPIAWIINLILYVLLFLAGLGGVSVILGGMLLAGGRLSTGKLLIMLGAGMGLFGLLISLGHVLLTFGPVGLMNYLMLAAQSAGWVGIVLSVVARMIAGKKKESSS